MKQAKLGTGGRFKAGVKSIMTKSDISKEGAAAIMAKAGREKYGEKKMTKWASAGRKKAAFKK